MFTPKKFLKKLQKIYYISNKHKKYNLFAKNEIDFYVKQKKFNI